MKKVIIAVTAVVLAISSFGFTGHKAAQKESCCNGGSCCKAGNECCKGK